MIKRYEKYNPRKITQVSEKYKCALKENKSALKDNKSALKENILQHGHT